MSSQNQIDEDPFYDITKAENLDESKCKEMNEKLYPNYSILVGGVPLKETKNSLKGCLSGNYSILFPF